MSPTKSNKNPSIRKIHTAAPISLIFPSLSLLCLFLLWCVLIVPVAAQESHDNRTIIVRADYDYPPYEYLDENGRPAGFSIEVFRAAADAVGLNYTITMGPWSEIREELESGKADVLTDMVYTKEREKLVDFSVPYEYQSDSLFVRKGSYVRSIADLNGKRIIIVQNRDISHDYLLQHNVTADILALETKRDVFMALAAGQGDAAIMPKIEGYYWIEKTGISDIEPAGPPLTLYKSCFAVKKGETRLLAQLNEGLTIIKQSGEYDKIARQWLNIPAVSEFGEPETRTIIVRADYDYPPYEYLDENGKPAGFSIEVFRAAADAVGLNYTITMGPWSEIREELESGKADVLTDMVYTKEREKLVDFSVPYDHGSDNIFVRKGSPVQSITDLSGKRIIVQNGDISHDYLVQNNITTDILALETKREVFLALAAGRGDAALMPKIEGYYWIEKSGVIGVEPVGPPLSLYKSCFAIKKGDTRLLAQLNEGLAIIKQSGKYDELYTKWFGIYERESSLEQAMVMIAWILIPLLLLLLAFFGWNWSLKRQVTQKTSELLDELEHRKAAEQAIRISEKKFRALVEGSIQGMAIVQGEPPRVVYLTAPLAEILGYLPDEILSLSQREAAELVYHEDRDPFFTNLKKRIEGTIGPGRYNLRLIHKSGEIRWVEMSSNRIEYNDKPAIMATFVDISERVRAEEQVHQQVAFLQKILDTIPNPVFFKDTNGIYLGCNAAFGEFIGLSREEIVGKTVYQISQPEDLADTYLQSDTKLLSQPGIQVYETQVLHRDGTRRSVIFFKATYTGPDDAVAGIIGVIVDITERKMGEEALRQATRKLSFLNTVAFNDIQNAVFSLAGYLELEKHQQCDEKMQQYIEKQSHILKGLSELLISARKYQDLGIKPPVWQNVMRSFLLAVSHVDLQNIVRDLKVDGLEIYADPLLEMVFLTLAENVILHGKTATRISLSYREYGDGLTLVFEDDGIGIPKDQKDMIFERKFEGKKGIGLFLTREILSITGITIQETGDDGKGARFEITVPKGVYRFTRNSK